MSLPLTRRIARAALLLAAGAAPVVGAAGAAHAATGLDSVAQPLGAIGAADTAGLDDPTAAVGTLTKATDKLPVGTPLSGLPVENLVPKG
ncbi:ATP-binding protein [Streptomyces sp. NPDC090022]|uniref:ATP-binding protein n=1 Tax=Streptomyces sp. NPDC090022 TaxID=3365920 RepID=UPI00382A33C2